jgi:hypothetical protein
MSDTLIVLHTAIAILAIVLLILVVRVDPVISLVIGTIYLGLAAGVGFEDTIGTIAQGFGDIMIEVGLLIGFGVLLGSLLLAMRALQDILGGFFSAEAGTPVLLTMLLAWVIAAVLHLAIGSISVAAITAAGILAPNIGWPRSPCGNHGSGHRLQGVVRITGKQQLLLDVPVAAGGLYPGSPQSAYPRNRPGLSSLPGLDPAA